MTTTTPRRDRIDLRLVLGLGALSLLYPVCGILTQLFVPGPAFFRFAWAISLWALIGIAWILVVWLTRAARPVLTLLATGAAGAVLTLLVAGIAQLVTSGEARLLGSPWAIADVVAMHLAGGAVCGLIAWGLQAATREAPRG